MDDFGLVILRYRIWDCRVEVGEATARSSEDILETLSATLSLVLERAID